jgi:hypothetical protein
MTSDGHLHAVYHRKDANGVLQIFHAESADGGKTWIEEQVTYATGDQCFPSLAVDSQNNLHMVWNDGWPSKPGIVPNTYYKKRVAGSWQDAELVASYATYPSIAIDSHDNVHVVYGTYVYEPGYYGGGNGIRWRMRTPTGWQPEEIVSSIDIYWQRYPAIAIDSNNDVHVVWDHSPRARYYDTHYRKRTASGWGPEIEISRDSDYMATFPSIAIDNNNYVHIVWHYREGATYIEPYAYGGNFTIRHRIYTDSWQPIEVIAGPTELGPSYREYAEAYPTVAVDGKGNIHVVWFGRHPESPSISQIRYRKYTTSWQPIEELTSSTSANQTFPSLMWAFYPIVNGVRTNQLEDGCAFIWMDGITIKYWATALPPTLPAPPVASFSYSPHNPMVNERVTFDASSSYDPDGGTIVNYRWELYRLTSDGAIIWPPMDIIEGSDKVIISYSFGKGEYLIKLTVKDDEDQTATTSKTLKVWEKWSFVFITDIHIGGYYVYKWYISKDYDSVGWNDNGVGEETVATQNLREIVQEINSHIEEYNIAFVVVGGDLTDSGEISEFNKAVEILNKLKVPWIPMMGNHDVWPYTSAENKAPEEQSDRYFNDIFVSKYQELSNLFQNWTKATVPVWNPETNPNHYSYFQNFAFDYKGYHLIFLDFNARDDAPSGKGVMAEGDLHDFTGGTWNWFTNHLREYVLKHPNSHENIILFAHHPFNEGIVSYMGFSYGELDVMRSFLRNYANNVWGEFAGHTHQNKDELWYEGILRVIETEAIVEKPIGRVVQVYYDGRIDYSVFLQKTAQAFSIAAHSPVDLKVTDPDGFIISKESNEIPGSIYLEEDLDEDGFLEDYIIISQRKIGDYSITVMPEYGANPTALYTLEVLGEDAAIVLAENVPISNIPSVPYLFSSAMLNVPPRTIFDVGEPKYTIEGVAYLTSATPIELIAEDNAGGSGVASTAYRIYNATYDSGWITYTQPFYLTGLSDGTYQIDYNSTDYAGNVESTNTVTVSLDNTPPTTSLTIGEPKYVTDTSYVTPDTPFTLEADDEEGSGVYSITYRIYNGTYDSGWLPYTELFYLTSLADGVYTIEFNSTDNLGNAEATKSIQVTLFSWNYVFTDSYGRGTTLKINLAHKFFQFITPDKDYGIRNATYMRQCGRAIIIQHCDKELRLITVAVDTKLDFCVAIAWDLQTRKQYFLIDKAGKE